MLCSKAVSPTSVFWVIITMENDGISARSRAKKCSYEEHLVGIKWKSFVLCI